jgi:hypothetical protein
VRSVSPRRIIGSMSPYEIIVTPTSTSEEGGAPIPPPPRPKFIRLKLALFGLVVAAAIIAFLLAAFTIGAIIAVVALGMLVLSGIVVFIQRLFSGRRG